MAKFVKKVVVSLTDEEIAELKDTEIELTVHLGTGEEQYIVYRIGFPELIDEDGEDDDDDLYIENNAHD